MAIIKNIINRYQIKEIHLILFLTLLALVYRLVVTHTIDNLLSGDAPCRLFYVANFKYSDFFFNPIYVDWPFLHFLMMRLVSDLMSDLYLGSRYVSAIFGALAVCPYYYFIRYYFNRLTSLCGATLLAFGVPFVFYSSVTLSEMSYIFFAFSALYLSHLAVDRKLIGLFVLCGIASALCSWVRIEGWLITSFVLLYLLWRSVKWKVIFFYIAIASVPPLHTFFVGYIASGDWLHILRYSDAEVLFAYAATKTTLYKRITRSVSTMYPFLFLISPILFFLYSKIGRSRYYVVISLIMFSMIFFKLFNKTLSSDPRYLLFLSLLVNPLLIDSILLLFSRKKENSRFRILCAVAIVAFCLIFQSRESYIKSFSVAPLHLEYDLARSASWAKSNINMHDYFILDENDHAYKYYWLSFYSTPVFDECSIEASKIKRSKVNLAQCLQNPKFRYLLLFKDGLLSPILGGIDLQAIGVTPILVYRDDGVLIYELFRRKKMETLSKGR